MKDELLEALNSYFVNLTFRADDGMETEVQMCWIVKVDWTRFEFKPSAVHRYTAPIARVVNVERTFPLDLDIESIGE